MPPVNNAIATLNETYDRILGDLPEHVRERLKLVVDKMPLEKKDTAVTRLRIYGTPLRGFWSSSWCFYEIGCGRYRPRGAEGWNVGGTGLFSAIRQKGCGGGKYEAPLRGILSKALASRPTEFTLLKPGDYDDEKEKTAFFLQRRYVGSQFPSFPIQQAAEDAVWLIQSTLPQIDAMLTR